MLRFSARTGTSLEPNALTVALGRAKASGRPLLDLTVSNPTRAGLAYDGARILRALADPRALTYAPEPFGLPSARAAVASSYADAGVPLDPSHVVLTASTSEAYAFLFKLLCDPGDEVLIPQPSYPLFDHIARLEAVTLVPYPLAYDGVWHIDASELRAAITPRSRAIFLVSPNNPTGSFASVAEMRAMAETGLPLVSDEVFAPFVLGDAAPTSILAAGAGELVFALNGLSKMAALPQMKLGWVAVGGTNGAKADEAMGRLELIADAFLSVGTPVQLALPELLATREPIVRAITERLVRNLATVDRVVRGTGVTRLDVQGGWYATLRLPRTETEEAWALLFLEEEGVYVHPGHFFDFRDEAYAVVSLLTPEPTFEEGVTRLVQAVEQRVLPDRNPRS